MSPLPIDKFPKLGALLTIDFDSIFQEQCAVNAETVFLFKFQITCLAFALVQFGWYRVCIWRNIELERLFQLLKESTANKIHVMSFSFNFGGVAFYSFSG